MCTTFMVHPPGVAARRAKQWWYDSNLTQALHRAFPRKPD
jgi:hypothetical protein